MKKVTENAYMQYIRSRPGASSDSNRRIKNLPFATCSIHSIFKSKHAKNSELLKENMLDQMKNYRPHGVRNYCNLLMYLFDFIYF